MPGRSKPIALLCLALYALPALARWEGPADNKPLSELEQMDIKALFNEGFDVCVRRAVVASGLPAEAPSPIEEATLDYLSVIEGVVRDKSNGKMPEWMRALGFAGTTKECQAVFRGFISGELRDTKPASTRPKPTSTEPVATVTPMAEIWATPTAVPKRKPRAAKPKPLPKPTSIQRAKPATPKSDVVDELPPWFRGR